MDHNTQHIDSELLAKFLSGEADRSEIDAVLNWMGSSEENIDLFNQFEKAWSLTGKPGQKPFDANRSWKEFNQRIETKRRRTRLIYPGLAAAVIALVVIFTQLIHFNPQITTPDFTLASLDSPIDTILPDGSEIQLAMNSEIDYSFDESANARIANLEGDAFFNIKRDTSQRFIVKTEFGGVEVLGTQFNVDMMDNNDVKVDVLSGRVKLFLPQTSGDTLFLIITDNETAVISMRANTIEKQTQEASAFYTVNETIVFKNTDLSTIISELEKCYHVEIEMDSTVDGSLKFTSSFKGNTLDEILMIITQTHKLDFSKEGDAYFIKKNEE